MSGRERESAAGGDIKDPAAAHDNMLAGRQRTGTAQRQGAIRNGGVAIVGVGAVQRNHAGAVHGQATIHGGAAMNERGDNRDVITIGINHRPAQVHRRSQPRQGRQEGRPARITGIGGQHPAIEIDLRLMRPRRSIRREEVADRGSAAVQIEFRGLRGTANVEIQIHRTRHRQRTVALHRHGSLAGQP